ncbi:hypothetical protein ANN_05091 [Periplaneta americana]|uniref:Uncharacterized protein n=1 Tax=Periplaneta americana TaxID=6978 RepID=A0ABQ8TB09_PERAM|nr:hypothetical protein ANN_05091 [Periplaneta americana]
MAGLCEGGNEPSGSLKAICNVLRQKGSGRRNTSLENIVHVQSPYVRSPRKSIHNAARELNLPHSTVHKVLHKNLRLFAHKVQLVQATPHSIAVHMLARVTPRKDSFGQMHLPHVQCPPHLYFAAHYPFVTAHSQSP